MEKVDKIIKLDERVNPKEVDRYEVTWVDYNDEGKAEPNFRFFPTFKQASEFAAGSDLPFGIEYLSEEGVQDDIEISAWAFEGLPVLQATPIRDVHGNIVDWDVMSWSDYMSATRPHDAEFIKV